MTFEAYYQPFKVEMDYEDYNRLVREKSFDLEPYNYGKDKDFKIDNRVGTFVFRWEYLPGSLIYAVYNLNDNNYYLIKMVYGIHHNRIHYLLRLIVFSSFK